MNTQKELIEWLRDAYAMEKAMEMTLKKQMESDETLQPLRDQFELHYFETQHHAELVASCLQQLGGHTSALKTTLAETTELLKNIGASFARDAHVKELLASYAAEHFEIGCYTALIAGAKRLGHPEIAKVCEEILADEKQMAVWLESNLPKAVVAYLQEPSAAQAGAAAAAPPRLHVEDIDTPVEAGSDDDPADAFASHDWEEEHADHEERHSNSNAVPAGVR